MNVALFTAAILCGAALVLLRRGLRGRRVGDRPTCRRCGYDLFGVPHAAVCSECGADLLTARAVQTGTRHRRRGLILLSLAILLSSGTWLGVGLYGAFNRFDPMPWKPVWWLSAEARSSKPATRDAALDELLRRIGAREVSAKSLSALIDHALSLQGETSRNWVPKWGGVVDVADSHGLVPRGKLERYARQSLQMRFRARPRVRRGDPLPISLELTAPRIGTLGSWPVKGEFIISVDDGLFFRRGSLDGDSVDFGKGTVWEAQIPLEPGDLNQFSDGPHSVQVRGTIEIRHCRDGRLQCLIPIPLDMQAPWSLHPAEQASVTPIDEPRYGAATEACLRASAINWGNGMLQFQLRALAPPVPLAYQVFLRVDDQEWKVDGPLLVRKGRHVVGNFSVTMERRPASMFHVVLRPSARVASGTLDLTEFWNGEIIKQVPVMRHQAPATVPADDLQLAPPLIGYPCFFRNC